MVHLSLPSGLPYRQCSLYPQHKFFFQLLPLQDPTPQPQYTSLVALDAADALDQGHLPVSSPYQLDLRRPLNVLEMYSGGLSMTSQRSFEWIDLANAPLLHLQLHLGSLLSQKGDHKDPLLILEQDSGIGSCLGLREEGGVVTDLLKIPTVQVVNGIHLVAHMRLVVDGIHPVDGTHLVTNGVRLAVDIHLVVDIRLLVDIHPVVVGRLVGESHPVVVDHPGVNTHVAVTTGVAGVLSLIDHLLLDLLLVGQDQLLPLKYHPL